MSRQFPLPLLFVLFLCTCGPADAPEGPSAVLPAAEEQFVLTEGASPFTVRYASGEALTTDALTFAGDSAVLYHEISGFQRTLRAYAADTAARFSDAEYLTYRRPDPRTLAVSVFTPRGGPVLLRYRRVTDPPVYPDRDSLLGRTFEFTEGGRRHVLHFGPETMRMGPRTWNQVYYFELGDEAAADRIAEEAILALPETGPILLRYSIVVNRADPGTAARRATAFRITRAGDGELRATTLVVGEAETAVPRPLRPRVSPLPAALDREALLRRLNRGRVVAGPPPPEPDSLGIEFAYPEDFAARGGVTYAELARLDFEFRGDSTYSMFAGDRVLRNGRWWLSPDRNLLYLGIEGRLPGYRLIQDYNDGYFSFTVPLTLRTREARGETLLSFYRSHVPVRFYAE